MIAITVQEIERDPLGWFRRVEACETLLVVRDDQPVAEITPAAMPPGRKQRPVGLAAGALTVPEDFDDPLPEDVLREFEGR